MIAVAWLSLLVFAFIPAPYNIICMFINGLPLGMIWGIVFSYLEGRRATEFLAAVMSISLVFASGFVKSLARFMMEELPIVAHEMPFVMGLVFAIPLVLFTLLLEAIPGPDRADKLMRNERVAMNHAERIHFLKTFLPGIVIVVFIYLIFSVLRDVRDNFEVEIWADVGVTDSLIYVQIDTIIALVVLSLMGMLMCVKNNMLAFTCIHVMLFVGCLVAGFFTYQFQRDEVDAVTWMMMTGLGLYMVYIPFNAIFFERFLASFKVKGNIGFLMYLADSVGYLGSVSILLVRELSLVQTSWGNFFEQAILLAAVLGCLAVLFSLLYFRWKKAKEHFPIEEIKPTS